MLVDYGGALAIVPALANPIEDARGLLKGSKSLTKSLREEHRVERAEELESIRAYDAAKASHDESIPFERAIREIERARK